MSGLGVDEDTNNNPAIWSASLTGQGWNLETLPPATAELVTAVTCPSECWAAGEYAIPGNGAGLLPMTSAARKRPSRACQSRPVEPLKSPRSVAQDNYCEVVGSYYNRSDRQVAFAERYSYTAPSGKCTDPDCPPPGLGPCTVTRSECAALRLRAQR